MGKPIARLQLTALDCPDPVALAAFYSEITGWAATRPHEDHPEWVQLAAPDNAVTLAFQRVENYSAPQWPRQVHPQQLHLDFLVSDLDAGEAGVLAAGAVKHEFQPAPDSFRIYLDPAGHPFCLVLESVS